MRQLTAAEEFDIKLALRHILSLCRRHAAKAYTPYVGDAQWTDVERHANKVLEIICSEHRDVG